MNVEQHITRRYPPQAKTVVSTLLNSGDDIQSFYDLGLTASKCERNSLCGLNIIDFPKFSVVVSDKSSSTWLFGARSLFGGTTGREAWFLMDFVKRRPSRTHLGRRSATISYVNSVEINRHFY